MRIASSQMVMILERELSRQTVATRLVDRTSIWIKVVVVLLVLEGALNVTSAQSASAPVMPGSTAISISTTHVRDLNLPRSAGAFSSPFRTTQVWDGGIVVYDPFGQTPVTVCDSVGRFQWALSTKQLSALKVGAVSAMLLGSDSLLQLFGSVRVSLDRVGTLSNTRLVPDNARASNVVESAKGRMTINVTSGPAAATGAIFQTLKADGSSNAFGAATLFPDSRVFEASWRAMCVARKGGFWALPLNQFRAERWLESGERVDELEGDRKGVWWIRWNGIGQNTAPDPRVVDCHEDSEGRLWVLRLVADSTWTRSSVRTHASMPTVAEQVRELDSVIDVFDVRTKLRVATKRFDGVFASFLGAGLISETMEGLNREVFVRVWSINLR